MKIQTKFNMGQKVRIQMPVWTTHAACWDDSVQGSVVAVVTQIILDGNPATIAYKLDFIKSECRSINLGTFDESRLEAA